MGKAVTGKKEHEAAAPTAAGKAPVAGDMSLQGLKAQA